MKTKPENREHNKAKECDINKSLVKKIKKLLSKNKNVNEKINE